jgi:two-component system sensor kinase FixL
LGPRSRPPVAIVRYGFAIVSALIAVGLAVPLEAFGLEKFLLLLPVAVAAWYGGAGPAVLALVLSTLALCYFFIDPPHSLAITLDRVPYVIVFSAFGLLTSWLAVSLRRAQQSLVQARDELQVKVEERTAELQRSNDQLRDEIAERTRAEAEATRQAALLSLAHDAILVRDLENRVVFWNRGAQDTYGWTAEEAIGRVTHELLRTRFPISLETVDAALREQGEWEGELTHITHGGATIVVASRQSLQRDERGAPHAILEINRDITDRKQAEEGLRNTQAKLAHVTRVTTLGELTASIAHEVYQPLTAVVTNAGACLRWLAGQPPNLEEARQSVEYILQNGNRAGEVIERIRALVKKSPPRMTSLSINNTILEVIALARSEVHSARVSLRTQLSDALPLVPGDPIQLQQVTLNLIINAIDAMRGGSEGPRELLVSSRIDGESRGVLVAVRDSGIGLSSESLDRLFDAFYTTKPDGMGMGLAISRSIIEAHGGRLWASPNESRGATFQFSLPAGEGRP